MSLGLNWKILTLGLGLAFSLSAADKLNRVGGSYGPGIPSKPRVQRGVVKTVEPLPVRPKTAEEKAKIHAAIAELRARSEAELKALTNSAAEPTKPAQPPK